jgi:hypothetical protein
MGIATRGVAANAASGGENRSNRADRRWLLFKQAPAAFKKIDKGDKIENGCVNI